MRISVRSSSRFSAAILGGLSALLMCATVLAAPSGWWIDITNDRVDAVKTALAQGENPNAKSAEGQPAVMQAIRDGAWEVYDLLAQHRKLDVNATNRTDETPLMYLAIVGDVKRAALLIKRGAQVNRLGWTPLHYAASKGETEMVKFLLSHKALVNAPSPDGTTPLMMAAFAGSEATVRELLGAGADVTTRNLQKQDAADWARLKEHASLAKSLDELTKRTLAAREAARAKNRSQGDTNSLDDGAADSPGVRSVDITATPVQPEPPGVPDANARPQVEDSGSRYFDLKRFDKEPGH